ncbi:hypothetical protein Xen7305DRAFT_00016250 [Xenococcus sp. PCC 7305]|uniref:hypothetical protein n=1 Tax=Xenococcus sp. PCC 7305 TaxID=102125 RepID=UPI0002ABF873|nr:hypothetical protein [Xenococcus sp. PCC 7305]ELS01918.1 hypothetical protein Xen7305DRAFT_00016250 [Xenococcus sp. PCC 7305]
MITPEDRENKLKEQELRRRELNSSSLPLSELTKHKPPESSFQRFSKKLVKFVKFAGFLVIGIALIRAGFWLGAWIAHLVIVGIIAFIGYKIFLNNDD